MKVLQGPVWPIVIGPRSVLSKGGNISHGKGIKMRTRCQENQLMASHAILGKSLLSSSPLSLSIQREVGFLTCRQHWMQGNGAQPCYAQQNASKSRSQCFLPTWQIEKCFWYFHEWVTKQHFGFQGVAVLDVISCAGSLTTSPAGALGEGGRVCVQAARLRGFTGCKTGSFEMSYNHKEKISQRWQRACSQDG